MIKKQLIFSFALLLSISVLAQKPEEIVFNVNGENVTLQEFQYIYEKNNSINKDEKLYSKESIEEYLDLYVNFKLKVHEAKSLGLDTTDKFVKEYNTYRDQLAQPYLKDKNVSEKLIEEAYNRMKWEIRASHILIDVAEDAFPSDTMNAYNTAMEAYNKVKAGSDFATTAKEYARFTRDETLEKRGGDLGYFTAFNMIYPFESASYGAKVNQVIKPIRTQYGYHVILVTDKRPYQGEMTAAHIMVRTDLGTDEDQGELSKAKIDSIYKRLKKDESFEDLARTESQHYQSASQGGRLRSFNAMARWLPDVIKNEAYGLKKDGDYSKPFLSEHGWHVIKRLELEPLKPYEEMKESIRKKVERDSRSQKSINSALRRIKKENRFKDYSKKGLKAFKTTYDTLIVNANWKPKAGTSYDSKLFRVAKKMYTQKDFADYLVSVQETGKFKNAGYAVDYYYETFVNQEVLVFEDKQLEFKYEEFKNISREYKEGILLFEITDNEVWTKAMKDTVGQKEFHGEHKGDYQWKERADVLVFYCKDKKIADQVKAKLAADNSNVNELFKEMNADNSMTFSFMKDVYERGEEELLAKLDWKKGFAEVPDYKDRYVLIKFNEILPAQPKQFKEIKGLVIADYQDYLEENWIKSLKAKYKIDVNRALINSLIK